MTTEEKIKAMRAKCKGINQWCDDCPLLDEDGCEFEVYDKARIDRLYSIMFPESESIKSDNPVVIPNYEAEYHRLSKENAQLRVENYRLKTVIIGMCKKFFFEEDDE